MKALFLYLFVASSLFAGPALTSPRGLEDIVRSLDKGDAGTMSRYVDATIEINLRGKTGSYSRSQGIMVLKNFFTANHVHRFDVRHKGSANGNQFCVGTLFTQSGNYRTSVFMTNKNGKELLKEIRFYPM